MDTDHNEVNGGGWFGPVVGVCSNWRFWRTAMIEEWCSRYCTGEKCDCGKPAIAKLEEIILSDFPYSLKSPVRKYMCSDCFQEVMGPIGLPAKQTDGTARV